MLVSPAPLLTVSWLIVEAFGVVPEPSVSVPAVTVRLGPLAGQLIPLTVMLVET